MKLLCSRRIVTSKRGGFGGEADSGILAALTVLVLESSSMEATAALFWGIWASVSEKSEGRRVFSSLAGGVFVVLFDEVMRP